MRNLRAVAREPAAPDASAAEVSASTRFSRSAHHLARLQSRRDVATGLLGAVAGAAVAFGGTEPASWAAVEILLFALAAYALWRAPHDGPRVSWIGPALLAAYLVCDVAVVRPAAYLARAQFLEIAACLCAVCLAAFAAGAPETRRSLWAGLVALGLVQALYGLVQYVTDWQQVLTTTKIDYTAQATGTYINPNNFAGLLEMLLPLAFARTLWELEEWIASARGANRRAFLATREGASARFVFFLFGTLLLTAALLFSRSRAGIATSWAGLLLVGAVWAVRRRAHSMGVAIVACLVAFTVAAGAWIGLGPVLMRYRTADQDVASRVEVWRDTVTLIRAHPAWGTGPGSFPDAYTRVQTSHLAARLNHAHNDYLEFAAEWGVPGAVLLFALIGFVWVRALRSLRRTAQSTDWFLLLGCCGGIFALLLHALVDFNLHIPANSLVFAVLLGLAGALTSAAANAPDRRAAPR
jgi:O-antigen ligase